MTNSVQTYEFTAFTEADLLAAGADGHSVNCGDTFTMPASATVCFSVTDDDGGLSGDNYCNENANDHYGQQAQITDAATGNEIGNGGQIYAEKYWVLHGSDGKCYYLIEIEQEDGNAPGTGDDYFTFYGEVPPAGVELTVAGGGNIKGDWLSYKHLDAGVKFTPDQDGKITIEAEDLELCGYKVEHQDAASGDELIKLKCGTGYAKLPHFGGESAVYDVEITVIDENDGQGFLDVFVDGEFVGCFQLDQDNGGNGGSHVEFRTLKLEGVEIPEGAEITLKGRGDHYEYIRIDKIDFCKVEFEVCDDPDAVKIDFEGLAAGDILGDLGNGVSVSASGGSGDAMVFDSAAAVASGQDSDLLTMKQGNILIVSEDGDSSDPDDAVGGTLTFTFDNPSEVFDIKVIDTEEGGTITATLADGSTVVVDIPEIANGGVAQVLLNGTDGLENVVSLEIALDGSGAIDDLCFVPGAPQVGTLSGRYFCDENRDALDNDGSDNGIANIAVVLLDGAGNEIRDANGALVTTTTDGQGNYSFDDLVAGTYGVRFIDENGATVGKSLVAADANNNQNDDIDSDAIGNNQQSQILGIEVVAGQNTPDNDAGVANFDPEAEDDTAEVCIEDMVLIDVLGNDEDPDGTALTISAVNGMAIVEGGSVLLDSGATVTLEGGQLKYDLSTTTDIFEPLLAGDSAPDSFVYTVTDGVNEDTATVDVTVKGATDTVEKVIESLQPILGTEVCFQITDATGSAQAEEFYTVKLTNTGDARLDGLVIDEAYCMGFFEDVLFGSVNDPIDSAPLLKANIYLADETSVPSDALAGNGANGQTGIDNLDLINWILNQDFNSIDNGDGMGETYTDGEIQGAIWALTDAAPVVVPGNGSVGNALEIFDFARNDTNMDGILGDGAEGFVVGGENAGITTLNNDIVGLFLDPTTDTETAGHSQPFIIGVELFEDCLC